jgi:CspA family cold shock protein
MSYVTETERETETTAAPHEAGRVTGTVKWFNDAKGYGFVQPDGGGPDVFVHYSAIVMEGYRTLTQGSRVSFYLVEGPKGYLAQDIQNLQQDPEPPPIPAVSTHDGDVALALL